MVALSAIAQVNPRPDVHLADDEVVSFLGMADVSEAGVTNSEESRTYGEVKRGYKAFANGDLLVARITPCFENGKIAQASIDQEFGYGSTEFHVIRVDPHRAEPRYLLHALRTPAVRAAGALRMTGSAGQRRVPKDFLEQLDIPLPSLSEQRRIASILDEVDTLRTMRANSISKSQDLDESIFRETFVSRDFVSVALEDLLLDEPGAIRTGPFGSQLLHSEFVDEGVAVLGIDNVVSNEFVPPTTRYITEQKYAQLSRYTVKPGDVLITIMGTVGRCVVVPNGIGRAINTKHLCCITLDQSRCLPEYLRAYFLMHPASHRYISASSKGAIMDGLNMGILRGLPVVLPPLSVQQSFVDESRNQRRVIESRRDHLAKLDELFASLQHRAFRGEL